MQRATVQNVSFTLSTLVTLIFTMSSIYTLRVTGLIVPEVIVTLCASFLAWAGAAYFTLDAPRPARLGFCGFLAGAFAQALLVLSTDIGTSTGIALKAFSILLFAIGTLSLAIAAFSFGKRRIFEALVILVFLRFFFAYAEYLMTALMGGFGLITFGLLMFGALYAWQKLRGRLFEKLEKQLHD